MKLESLRDLYIDELKDLYNAEHQLLKALPKMAKAASTKDLKRAFESHLKETKGQVESTHAKYFTALRPVLRERNARPWRVWLRRAPR